MKYEIETTHILCLTKKKPKVGSVVLKNENGKYLFAINAVKLSEDLLLTNLWGIGDALPGLEAEEVSNKRFGLNLVKSKVESLFFEKFNKKKQLFPFIEIKDNKLSDFYIQLRMKNSQVSTNIEENSQYNWEGRFVLFSTKDFITAEMIKIKSKIIREREKVSKKQQESIYKKNNLLSSLNNKKEEETFEKEVIEIIAEGSPFILSHHEFFKNIKLKGVCSVSQDLNCVLFTDLKGFPELEGSILRNLRTNFPLGIVVPGFFYMMDSRQYITLGYTLKYLVPYVKKLFEKKSEISQISPVKENADSENLKLLNFWRKRTCKISIIKNLSRETGTCVLINSRLIMTNRHLFETEEEESDFREAYVHSKFDNKKIKIAKILKSKGGFDISFCILETPASLISEEFMPPIPVSNNEIESGQIIWSIGNPIFDSGFLDYEAFISKGSILGYDSHSQFKKVLVLFSTLIFAGNSGGPIVSEEGQLIGLVFCNLQTPKGVINEINLAVNTISIADELNYLIRNGNDVQDIELFINNMQLFACKNNEELSNSVEFWKPSKRILDFSKL